MAKQIRSINWSDYKVLMKIFATFLIALSSITLMISEYSIAASTSLKTAAVAFEKKQTELARKQLDSIPVNDPTYRHAFLEMQKLHYRNGEWNKFFGYATYYRKQLLKKFLEPDLLLLEVLALVRHCQFFSALKISNFSKNIISHGAYSQAISREAAQSFNTNIKSVDALLEMHLNHESTVPTEEVSTAFKAFTKTLEWKIPLSKRSEVLQYALHSPRALRVYVKNDCKEDQK